jgi:hypothetical protein
MRLEYRVIVVGRGCHDEYVGKVAFARFRSEVAIGARDWPGRDGKIDRRAYHHVTKSGTTYPALTLRSLPVLLLLFLRLGNVYVLLRGQHRLSLLSFIYLCT